MAPAYRMSVVEALKSGQGTLPMKATYSSSSHCDDENSWSDDTTVSEFSPENMKSPRAGDRADAVATGPDTEKDDPADTGSCGDGTGHVKPGAALRPPTSPADEASVKQFKTALFNICLNSDDSKFMGIAQLNTILKSDTKFAKELRKSETAIPKCWEAIPGRFLDRLLAVTEFKGKQVVDRDWVTNHIVSFIHTAVQGLPESDRNDKKFAKRIDKLLIITGLEMYVLSETKTLALEVLDALADTPNGSTALLTSKNWPVLLQSAAVNPITRSIDDKAYRHAFTHKTAKDLLSLQPELHKRISDWATIMRLVPDATPLFEHVHNLVRWHVPKKEISDAPDWLAPLTERLLESASIQYTDALRSRNAVVLLSAALVRCYPAHFPTLLYESRPYVKSSPTSKPMGWMFLQHRLVDIRCSIPSLMDSPADDHKSTLVRLAGCYELVTAFTRFLAESSDVLLGEDVDSAGETGGSAGEKGNSSKAKGSAPKSGDNIGSDELPFSPGLLLRIREDISNTCSLTMEHLHDRFEAWEAGKTIRRAGPGINSATGHFEFVHKDSGLPNMAEDPLVIQQLRMLSLWLREDDSEILRKEAASTMVKVILGLYGMAEELRSPLLILLEQCKWVPDALNDIRGSSGWKAMVSDLDSIVRSRAPDKHVIQDGVVIIDILGPLASSSILRDVDNSVWIEFARIAVQLDTEGSAAHLDLKCSTTMLAIDLLRLVNPRTLTGATNRLKKRLLAVPSRLMTAGDRMNEDTLEDLDGYLQG